MAGGARMVPGVDHVGLGVGAIVFGADGRVFLARRGAAARNEVGCWEFPGGTVEFGERLVDCVVREFREEFGIGVDVVRLLGVFDHILAEERQHWVSATYVARHTDGVAVVREPDRCSEVGWFDLAALPEPLSQITRANADAYLAGSGRRDQPG